MNDEQGETRDGEAMQPQVGRKLAVEWSETEWFAVWLRLARREYHGKVAVNRETGLQPAT